MKTKKHKKLEKKAVSVLMREASIPGGQQIKACKVLLKHVRKSKAEVRMDRVSS